MLLAIIGWLIVLPVAVPACVFLVEVATGLPRGRGAQAEGGEVSFAVLMPAHDEAATIAAVVRPLAATLPPRAKLLVVADNCSDATSDVARAAGAEVVERRDPARRGKGFALDFGRAHLAVDPPEVVIVLDADCRIAGDGAGAARLAAAGRVRPVQARYVFTGDLSQPAMVQVSNFALLVKNLVRQRGLARLGVPVPLGGTGMAFPWRVFAGAALATDDLVEDLVLGLQLAEAGEGATYLDGVSVTSAASTAGGTLVQRTRWEHGFLSTARRHGLGLLRRGLARGDLRLVWLALHLMTPPLALLVTLLGLVTAIEGALLAAAMPPGAFIAALALLALIGGAVLVAWAREGRATLAAGTLARLPLYVLWKLPLYLRLGRKRETRWIRSERTEG